MGMPKLGLGFQIHHSFLLPVPPWPWPWPGPLTSLKVVCLTVEQGKKVTNHTESLWGSSGIMGWKAVPLSVWPGGSSLAVSDTGHPALAQRLCSLPALCLRAAYVPSLGSS